MALDGDELGGTVIMSEIAGGISDERTRHLDGYDRGVTTTALTDHELEAWRTSIRMLELLRTRLEQEIATNGLSLADYTVLALLSEAPGGRMRPFELGEAADWEKSRLHHQLTRMEKRGLVEREPCGSRGMEAVITPQGLAAIRAAAPGHAAEVRRLFIDALTPTQLDQFAEISAAILARLTEE